MRNMTPTQARKLFKAGASDILAGRRVLPRERERPMAETKHHLNMSMYQIRKERDVMAGIIRVLRPLAQRHRVAVLTAASVLSEVMDAPNTGTNVPIGGD